MGSAGPRSGALTVQLPKKLRLPNSDYSDPQQEEPVSVVTDKRDQSPTVKDVTPNTAIFQSPPSTANISDQKKAENPQH